MGDSVPAAIAAALTAPELAAVVDLVAYPVQDADGQRAVMVHGQHGVVRLHAGERHEVITGVDPVAHTDPVAFLPYESECADPSPENRRNAYPEPARRLLSFFADADRSPDVVIVHTPSHYFPETGGHRGEHGSLDVIQSRAPFLLSGAGVTGRGLIPEHVRVFDVAPTLLDLAGVTVPSGLDGTPTLRTGRGDVLWSGCCGTGRTARICWRWLLGVSSRPWHRYWLTGWR